MDAVSTACALSNICRSGTMTPDATTVLPHVSSSPPPRLMLFIRISLPSLGLLRSVATRITEAFGAGSVTYGNGCKMPLQRSSMIEATLEYQMMRLKLEHAATVPFVGRRLRAQAIPIVGRMVNGINATG